MTASISTRAAMVAVIVAAVAALGGAYLLEYGFGLEPCSLCLWQRLPWALTIIVGIVTVAIARPQLGLLVAALALFANAALAGYHVGVEQGVFALPSGCLAVEQASSIDDLRAQLAAAPARCDQIPLSVLGISLAGWNGVASAVIAIAAGFALVRGYRKSVA